MPIDTRIDGSPTSIRQAATWLRDLKSQVEEATGSAFGSEVSCPSATSRSRRCPGRTKADDLARAVDDKAKVIDEFAGNLERAQRDMD